VLLSSEGFARSQVDPALLRAEYEYALVAESLSQGEKESLQNFASESDGLYQVRIAGEYRGGLQAGLGLVRDFLIVAVLITAVLATVNVYASTVYLLSVQRRSFAILLSLGLTNRRLVGVLGLTLSYVVFFALLCGIVLGQGLFTVLRTYVGAQYLIMLPQPEYIVLHTFTALFLVLLVLSAFVPTLQHVRSLKPKQILMGDIESRKGVKVVPLLFMTTFTLLPLMVASVWLLESVVQGIGVVVGVGVVYLSIASVFSVLLFAVYSARARMPFILRAVVAQKRADGLFGIISFTSLFVALTALSTLVLLQVSLERYLTNDLSHTVPSTYILDVQPSQRDALLSDFPELSLFSSTPARIMAIDEVRIQDELSAGSPTVDRELGREFNVTARAQLLESERIVAGGEWVGTAGEVSVDEAFAKRADIRLGSRVELSIQGFPVEAVVTSLRETDSRSGLPFFYFLLSPEDLAGFPVVYFGYAEYGEEQQTALARFVAGAMPNVSILKTQALAPRVLELTRILLLIILIVAIPPLLIAVLLVGTLIISSYSSRRLEGARMRALGATVQKVLGQYLLETISLTASAGLLAYVFGVGVAYGVSQYFFKLDTIVLFDRELLLGISAITALVLVLGVVLFKSDTMKLRELLSYGDR
jgi:putative ABC transport system permease protein